MVARSNTIAQYRARAAGKVAFKPVKGKFLGKSHQAPAKNKKPAFLPATTRFSGKGGKAKGGSKGQWVFVPSPAVKGKGGGKGGKGGKGGNGGKGTSVGKGSRGGKGRKGGKLGKLPESKKFLEKLSKVDTSLKVWVGGLSEKTNWKMLGEHFKTLAEPTGCALMGKGRACVAFKTTDDVASSIATFNGSELDGKTIEVDVWTKKEKKEGDEKPRKKKPKMVIKTAFAKKSILAKGDRRNPKTQEKLRTIEFSKKVWVGGLDDKVTLKKLREHFSENGCATKLVDYLKPKGTAVCAFETEAEAEAALVTLNATTLEDKAIEVQAWKKAERREKKVKEATA